MIMLIVMMSEIPYGCAARLFISKTTLRGSYSQVLKKVAIVYIILSNKRY